MDNDNTMSAASQQPGEKKPKRPRIGQMRTYSNDHDQQASRYDNGGSDRTEGEYGQYQRRPYQQRQGAYGQPRQSSFPRSPYYDRQQQMAEGHAAEPSQAAEGAEHQQPRYQGGYQLRQGGYGQRQYGAQQQADGEGYTSYQQRQEGGYQQRPEGGYNNNRQGYSNNRQGGYGNRQGGQRQGGYNNRQGGYGQQRPGGNRQGG